ncbi:MAG: helix-turn-helix transcriptional regulator, partial [Lentisphaeria bacterium]|nr:helix-turn-helix transcriptional regulator [Lentisphaeria bacterium]
TGFSPMDYLLNLRLAKAEELLRTTSLPLTDISAKCGFYDSNYFGMQFRKRYDITPHRFRRLFR